MNTHEIPSPPPCPDGGVILKTKGPREKKYSLDDLHQLINFTQEKIQSANQAGVNVDTQIHHISCTIIDSPPIYHSNTNEIVELALNRLIIVMGIYCCQIIRKLTKNHIVTMYNQGINRPEFQKMHGLMKQCKDWALKQLPEKFTLQPPYVVDLRTRGLLVKVEEMKYKILQKL